MNQNEYAYDGLNQRVWMHKLPSPTASSPNPSTAVKTYEIYSSNGQLLVEYTPSQGSVSGKVDEHIYLGTKRIGLASRHPAAASATSVHTYFHLDPAATPLLATTGVGTVAWKENHQPYGDKLNNPANASSNTIAYAGKPYDNATGLSYMGARYYHPTLGRFTGIDPVGFTQANLHSHNRYTYANNNPYKFVDPDGRSPVNIAFGIFSAGLAAYDAYGAYQTGGWAAAGKSLATDAVLTVATFGMGKAAQAFGKTVAAVKDAEKTAVVVAKEAAPVGINITEKGLKHTVERHVETNISKYADKSKFNKDVNVVDAIKAAEQHPAVLQPNGNYSRTYDTGKPIGFDRATNKQTSEMTVISKPNGDLVTSFPGPP